MFRGPWQTGLLVSASTVILLCSFAVFRLIAQENRNDPPSERPSTNADLPVDPPRVQAPQEASELQEKLERDPVLQELKRAFSLAPSDAQRGDATSSLSLAAPTKNIPKSRWLAVEKLLAAARLLESEAQLHGERQDIEASNRLQKSVQSIRSQAVELLMKH